MYTQRIWILYLHWSGSIWCSGPHKNVPRVRENQRVLFLHCSLTYTYCWLFLFPPPPSISSSFLINSWVPFLFLYTHSDTQKVSIFSNMALSYFLWCDVMWCVTTIDILFKNLWNKFFFFLCWGLIFVVGDVGFRDKFGDNCYWIWHECHFHCICLYKNNLWKA